MDLLAILLWGGFFVSIPKIRKGLSSECGIRIWGVWIYGVWILVVRFYTIRIREGRCRLWGKGGPTELRGAAPAGGVDSGIWHTAPNNLYPSTDPCFQWSKAQPQILISIKNATADRMAIERGWQRMRNSLGQFTQSFWSKFGIQNPCRQPQVIKPFRTTWTTLVVEPNIEETNIIVEFSYE